MHVDILGRKGCSRTALEVSKLILSLNPLEDHMGSLFLLEYFSIRCKKVGIYRQFEYFFRVVTLFCEENYGFGSIIWMPDYMFSTALVKGMEKETYPCVNSETLERLGEVKDGKKLSGMSADVVLAVGIYLYPELAREMMRRLAKGVGESDTLKQSEVSIGDITHITAIYIERCSDLWKPEEVSTWLQTSYNYCASHPIDLTPLLSLIDLPFSLSRYSGLDKGRFSEAVHTAVPEELMAAGAVHRPARPRGNLNRHMHPVLLYLALLVPWNSVDFADAN